MLGCIEVNGDNEAVNQEKKSHCQGQQLFAGMMIDKTLVNFQIDCWATYNIIPIHLLKPDTAWTYGESASDVQKDKFVSVGFMCKVKIRNPRKKKLCQLEFQLVDHDSNIPLLGRKASEAMKLIKVEYENILAIDSMVA